MLGCDAPSAQDQRAGRPIDNRVRDTGGGDRDQIRDRAGAKLSLGQAERSVGFTGCQRERVFKLLLSVNKACRAAMIAARSSMSPLP